MSDDDETPDWQLCADWLIRCQIFTSDQMQFYGRSVEMLAMSLKDGVLLCHLLNRLKPDTIDPKNFSQRPQMSQFLCLKNIRVFLQMCKKVFNLRDHDLFEPDDLFETKNFSKVIHTLAMLSQTKEAKKKTKSFCETGEYYNIVADLQDEVEYNVVDNRNEEEEEDVYGRLVDYGIKTPERTILAAVPKSKRDMCIAELVNTETNYIDVLVLILDKFMKPLKNVLSTDDIQTIFFGIEDLLSLHRDLRVSLLKSANQGVPDPSTVAGCFLNFKMKMLKYGEYCSRLERAQKRILELCLSKQQVRDVVDRAGEEAKVGLRDLLTVPVQRILKYHLLLRELIKHTGPERSGDHTILKQALDTMEDVSMYINEVKRDTENLDLIQEIENSIVNLMQYMPANTHLKDYGRRINDGELKIRLQSEKTYNTRYLFLFDRVLLICKAKGEIYLYKDVLNLHQFDIDVDGLSPKEKSLGCYFMLNMKGDASKRYVFEAKSQDVRNKWISLLHLAKDNIRPKGAETPEHYFVLTTVNEPTVCQVCQKLLRGVFFQGYRCAKTSMTVHKECILKLSCENTKAKGEPVIAPRAIAALPSRVNKGFVKAERPYDGNPPPNQGRRPLKFIKGDIFTLTSDSDTTWWEGRFDNGNDGFFPKDKVRKLPAYEVVTPSPPIPPRSGVESRMPNGAENRSPNVKVADVHLAVSNRRSDAEPEDLNTFPWFAGDVGREECGNILKDTADGTFLLRYSPVEDKYVLSIRYDDAGRVPVKHIRIHKTSGKFSLNKSGVFNSLSELVEFYQKNSLKESFEQVSTKLILPYREVVNADNQPAQPLEPGILCYCIALYDFSANEPNQLSFSENDRISVISKTGRYQLWWKGKLNGQVGYFPSNYVRII